MNETRKPRLRWYQFSLRSLCLVMILACVGMSWVGVRIREARRQKAVVEQIKKFGGQVGYDYGYQLRHACLIKGTEPLNRKWLRTLLGDDFISHVVAVDLDGTQVTDAGLEHLNALPQLELLSLERTQVSDAGLEHLKGLTQLQDLNLCGTQVMDHGLEQLEGLVQLQILYLDGTQVTDAGMEHLEGLAHLQVLVLSNSQVTDEGIKKLQQVLPNCKIHR